MAHQNYLGFVATNTAGKCSDVSLKTTTIVITDTAEKFPDISLKSPQNMARLLQRSLKQWSNSHDMKVSSYTSNVNMT